MMMVGRRRKVDAVIDQAPEKRRAKGPSAPSAFLASQTDFFEGSDFDGTVVSRKAATRPLNQYDAETGGVEGGGGGRSDMDGPGGLDRWTPITRAETRGLALRRVVPPPGAAGAGRA